MKTKFAIAVLTVFSMSSCAQQYNRTALLKVANHYAGPAAKSFADAGVYKCYAAPVEEQQDFMYVVSKACFREYAEPMPELMSQAEFKSVSDQAAMCACARFNEKYGAAWSVDTMSTRDVKKCLAVRQEFETYAGLK